LSETTWVDPVSMEYHMKQWAETKQSTKVFAKLFNSEINSSNFVIDIGAGGGASTFYIAQSFPKVSIRGIELSPELVSIANKSKQNSSINNLTFEVGDWFSLDSNLRGVDGVISLQTISWIEELHKPMEQIFTKIKPKWIGLSGLFYDGDITCRTEVYEHTKNRKVFYNTYSLKELGRIVNEYGYEISMVEPFFIDIDIQKSENIDIMGTYTRMLCGEDEPKRIQISGPLLLNWYFVKITKKA
jgi:cyclopropane fatty-acyl-phospholipid synthase-like methyltransferase